MKFPGLPVGYQGQPSPPARGAWIEIWVFLSGGVVHLVAPRTGGVD